jgi:hypothetical protein
MKYFILSIFLCLLTSCSSIRWITIEKGQIVTQNNQPVHIVGNPPMVCTYADSLETFSGYFMYQENNIIALDAFGTATIYLAGNPVCKLGYDE